MNIKKTWLFNKVKQLLSPLIQEYIYLKGMYLFKSIYNKRCKVNVMSDEETIDYIIANRCSISRFGDGEINFITAAIKKSKYDAGFQLYDVKLAKRLQKIISCSEVISNLLVCVPACCFKDGLSKLLKRSQAYWSYYVFNNIDFLLNITNHSYLYGDTNLTRFYINIRGAQRKSYIQKLKNIWDGRDIVFVEGNLTHLGYGNDLFSNAKSIKRILCPNKNAWNCYDSILSTVISHTNNDTLIIIALGMTATVLAVDLAKAGRQALDLGHIDIEYEWMIMGATEKVPIPGKFVNEASGGDTVSIEIPEDIKRQVITTVGI